MPLPLARVVADDLHKAQTANQAGVYYDAAVGVTWDDLTAADFLSLGTPDALLGPVACTAGQDFVEVNVSNEGPTVLYLVFRAHYVSPPPGLVPEDPLVTAIRIPAGATRALQSSMVDGGAAVTSISIRSSAPGGVANIVAYFATR